MATVTKLLLRMNQLRLELPPPAVGALSLSEALDRDYLLVEASARRKRKRSGAPREEEEGNADGGGPPSSSAPAAFGFGGIEGVAVAGG